MTHTSTEQPERSACPACQGKPFIRHTNDVDGMRWHHVECAGCGLRTRGKWTSHYSDECQMFFQEVWAEWPKAPDSQAQRAPLTEWLIAKAARVLSDRAAESCGINAEDQWKIYAEDFKDDARAILAAIGGITQEKQG